MIDAWPALCTLLALVFLLVMIIRWQVNAFVAMLTASLVLGLAAGMGPVTVLETVAKGVGDIMKSVAIILALGAMLGRMLDASGGAGVIARTLVNAFGQQRASLAILLAAYLIGIPILFNVGFLVLIPIMWQLQRQSGKSLLWFVLPLSFSLGITHSLVPPHPGIVGAVNNMAGADASRVMVETIIFGALMGIPMTLVGWLGPGRWWAKRQFVMVPAMAGPEPAPVQDEQRLPGFGISVLIVTLPLILSLASFGVKLQQEHLPQWMKEPLWTQPLENGQARVEVPAVVEWLAFLGHPTMALFIPTGLAFWLLGMRRGMPASRLAKIAGDALQDVGSILFLFGAAGGFKEVIQATGAGDYIAEQFGRLPLTPVLVCYLVAVLLRIALGSATAAILTASALLVKLAGEDKTLLVLAVANGVTFMTQPADSGFWMVKEYCNLSVREVLIRFNACRILMSLTGLVILLLYEAWR